METRIKRIHGNKQASQNNQIPREKRRANSTPERKAGEERFRCEDNSTKAESTAQKTTTKEVAQFGKRHPQKTEGKGRNSPSP